MREDKKLKKCCICGCEFDGWGNNPYPCVLGENVVCCDACNWEYVIPARLIHFGKEELDES